MIVKHKKNNYLKCTTSPTLTNFQKMKASKLFILVTVFAVATLSQAQDIKPAEVKQVMQKVADWQIAHFQDFNTGDKDHHPLAWDQWYLVRWHGKMGCHGR
ncbi:MAG TPA: hypothetical protein VF985_08240 [Mariniflexile sp.]